MKGGSPLSRGVVRRLLVAWVLFAAVLAVLGPVFWIYTALTGIGGLDFVAFYSTARLFLEQGSPAVFSSAALAREQAEISAPWGGQPFLPDFYPPYWVLAQAWLGWLPLTPAYLAWGALSLAATGLGLILLAQTVPEVSRRWALLVGFGFLPVVVNLLQGQSDAFVLLGAALALWAWRSGHDALAGVALGLVLVKPQLGFLLVALPFIHRSRAAVAGLLGAALLLAGLSLAVFGASGLAAWAHLIAHDVLSGGGGPTFFRPWLSLRGPLVAAGLPTAAQYAVLAALAGGLLLLLARRPRDLRVDFAIATSGALLLSPHLNFHDLSLLVVPGMLLAALDRGRALAAGAYVGGTVAIWVAPAAILAGLALLAGGLFTGLGVTAAEAGSRSTSRPAPPSPRPPSPR